MIQLTEGQEQALEDIKEFVYSTDNFNFVLSGFSGTGKTFTMSTLIEYLDRNKVSCVLTATTNKAAENLRAITHQRYVPTIHKLLGLIIRTNYKTGEKKLIRKRNAPILLNQFIIIDEASYVDLDLLSWIGSSTENCKILYVGDPDQLLNVKSFTAPVFHSAYREAKLTKVVRQQADNPIIDLAVNFRNVVVGKKLTPFTPDGLKIRRLATPQDAIDEIISLNKLNSLVPSMVKVTADTKVLAWTNKAVIGYNTQIHKGINDRNEWKEGDMGICNKTTASISNGREVYIEKVDPHKELNIEGSLIKFSDLKGLHFVPDSYKEVKKVIKQWRKDDLLDNLRTEDEHWVDLRHSFALTVNKAQGSTYKRVYVDLNNISKCRLHSQKFRMLYVAVSRASEELILIGDLV